MTEWGVEPGSYPWTLFYTERRFFPGETNKQKTKPGY